MTNSSTIESAMRIQPVQAEQAAKSLSFAEMFEQQAIDPQTFDPKQFLLELIDCVDKGAAVSPTVVEFFRIIEKTSLTNDQLNQIAEVADAGATYQSSRYNPGPYEDEEARAKCEEEASYYRDIADQARAILTERSAPEEASK